jgi:hypothetical protein
MWSNYPGTPTMSNKTSGRDITYTFKVTGTTLPANSNVTFDAQWASGGVVHSDAGDTYSVATTVGGKKSTLTGSF